MDDRKSMGSALVDVFDAGVTLAKSEINNVTRKVGETAKAKGLGAVLLLAATGPLIMALIFLILAVFYGLVRLGLGPWAAALLIAIFSLVLTGALVFIGLKKLGAEVKSDEPLVRRPTMTDSPDHTDLKPQVSSQGTAKNPDDHSSAAKVGAKVDKVEPGRDATQHAAGETRIVKERQATLSTPGSATVRLEEGPVTVPVYESKADGAPQMYGSGLNEKLEQAKPVGDQAHAASAEGVGTPVVVKNAPGIQVSTDPTYPEDMKKGGL